MQSDQAFSSASELDDISVLDYSLDDATEADASFVSSGSKEIILDDDLDLSEDPLTVGHVFSDSATATFALISDSRHVGLQF